MASRLTIGQQRYQRAVERLHERYADGYADRTVVEFLPDGHPRGWRRRFRPRPDGSEMDDILTATEFEHVTGSEAVDSSAEDPGPASEHESAAWLHLWSCATWPLERRQPKRNALDALATPEAWPMPYSRPAAADGGVSATAAAADSVFR